jgi:Mce-associated membrane protein
MTTFNRHHAITELERIVPVDTDSITDESPPGIEEASALGGATVDNDECTYLCDEAEAADELDRAEAPGTRASRFSWKRSLAYGVLPALALILALGAGYLKWQDGSARLSRAGAAKSVQVAAESTIAMLSYHPDTVDKDLAAAGDRLTETFRDAYAKLIKDVVIPGARQKQISVVATVPAAASVSATEDHAVALIFVNQTVVIGQDAPTNITSSVRVTLDKVNSRWLISAFDPI